MRLRPIVLCLALFAFPLAAENGIVPSRVCRGLFFVPVTWNGTTLSFVLDTGASITSIDPDSLERLTGARRKPGKEVTLRHGEAGALKLNRIRAKVHELDHLTLAIGQAVDGILGFDTFHELLLTLDYPAGEVRVAKGPALPEPDGREVFRDVGKSRPYIEIDVGRKTVPVLLDSGFTGGINLDEGDPLVWIVEPRPVYAVVRYSEVVIRKAGRLAEDLAIGPLTITTPVVRQSDGTRLVGADVMRHMVLTFDSANRRIRMVPAAAGSVRMEPIRNWGLAYHPRTSGMEIIRVFPGTPAEAAGLREGDVLTAVDGVHVHERGCESLNRVDEDKPQRVTVVRNGSSFDVTLTAVDLVP